MNILRHKSSPVILLIVSLLLNNLGISNTIKMIKNEYNITSVPMIRIKMNGLVNSLDETVIYYQSGATDGFDSNFDSYKLFGPNPAPHISQVYNSTLMAINGIEPVVQIFSINLLATTHTTGNFTITASDYFFLPRGTCVYLYDSLTNSTVDLLNTSYSFNLSNTTTTPRFTIKITHYKLNTIYDIQQATCQNINSGKFKVTATDYGPWNYLWKDSTGTIIKTTMSSNNSDSLDNLYSGFYNVEITSVNNACYYSDTSFYITPIVLPTVIFTSADSIVASVMQNCTPQNQSSNCENFQWDFGDGSGYSNGFEPTYSYSSAGIYHIKLIGISSSGCRDSSQNNINVLDIATSLNITPELNIKVIDIGSNQFKLSSNTYFDNELLLYISNLEGKCVFNQTYKIFETEEIILNLNHLYSGMYIFNIKYGKRSEKSIKIFIKQ